jgi:23S rRNA pseudouridine1911/1915/1917 synthase
VTVRREIRQETTLGDCLRALLPDASGRTRKKLLDAGRVRVNGVPKKIASERLAPGDVVEIGGSGAPARTPRGLVIVHEDDDVIVVVKAPKLLTIATDAERARTAYAYLSAHVKRRTRGGKIFVVHRLDRLASGLLVFAKSREMKIALQAQFEAHTAERLYVAIVEGRPAAREGVVDLPLVEDASGRMRIARPGDRGAREAVTRWRVVRESARTTTLDVRLETGRKNQIRVHLAAIGHPIVGDERYGSRTNPIGRLALHARLLAFDHPRRGERLRFESPPPAAFGLI